MNDKMQNNVSNNQEIDELKAQVERLRNALMTVNRIWYEDCFTASMPAKDYIELSLAAYPAKVLDNIKAQVEGETTEIKQKYNELLMAVQTKFDNETRHETALRYIMQAENTEGNSTQTQEQSND